MAEPRATAPIQRADGPEPDMLLATKLHVPRPRPGWVPRPRLVDRLAEGMERELVVVCAPAGFGKSSLLADWVRGGRRSVAWLSLDEGDNDPARFWRHAAAALDTVAPGVAERVGALLGGGGLAGSSFEAPVITLVNTLAGATDDIVLVIDDYHVIAAPDVHRSLTLLLEHLPGCLHLVLASRTDPPLPLARLRARGQLTELRAADLRFTSAEAGELLRGAVGYELSDATISALGQRTEGWVAGLQLAALSLQGRSDIAGFVAEFSGSHRFVLDYLTEEVLDRQSGQLQAFLLETSVLERLSGSLCDAVRGRSDSQQLLERIERANLFLHPLDGERRWWRYHHLFADLLRAQLVRQQPARLPELHRAAAAWYERHELPDDAIRHALAAGDTAWAARLIERYLDEQIVRRSERATLTRWLAALPPEVLHRRPRLSLGQAIVALLGGRLDEVEPLLAVAERGFDDAAFEPYEPSIDRGASVLANVPACIAVGRADLARLRGESQREGELARQALTHVTDEDRMLGSIARYHVAVSDWLGGELGKAERALVAVVAERTASGDRHMVLRARYDLGNVQQAQGRLGSALRTHERGLDVAACHPPLPSVGMAHVGLAEVLYERDELGSAEEHASAGVDECRQLAYAPPLVTGLLSLARIRQARGDTAGALDAVEEAAAVQPQVVDLRNPVAAVQARLALARGAVADAARWVAGRGLDVEDEPTYPREREYLVFARVLLAGQEYELATGLLERWHALAADQQRPGSSIELRTLQALARAGRGDRSGALAALAEALALAAPEGYLRVFADEGTPMAALLRELLVGRRLEQLAGAVPRGFLTRLAAAFDRLGIPILPTARRGALAVPGLVEPLTNRQQEVLALLAQGRPNRAIADELVITLDTVKRHVSHLFDKLAVANRTQAVGRARQLGLLR